MGEMQGILMGDVVCEECPQKRKRVGADKQGEMGEKLQKLSFLMLEIMLKMDISRQTK
jgi:hypothetical protein